MQLQADDCVLPKYAFPGNRLSDSEWNYFLSMDGEAGDAHKANVHVYSDSVLCLGRVPSTNPLVLENWKQTEFLRIGLLLNSCV